MSVTTVLTSAANATRPIDADRLPVEIRESARTVVWKWEMRDGRPTKTPYVATAPQRYAKTNAPATWCPFGLAMDAVRNGHADGVGVVLGEGLAGVDLDDCRDPETGVITPWAQQIIDDFNSYTEISPSKTGVKIWVRVNPTLSLKGKNYHRPDGGAIEIYVGGKYFTVTADYLANTPATIEQRTEQVVRLHKQISSRGDIKKSRQPERPVVEIDDDTLIEMATGAKNGVVFSALLDGDTSLHGDDDSAADLAFCNMLAFWTGRDAGRMDRLYRRSGLCRSKWDERRGDRTYGEMTIEKAIAGCHDTYSAPSARRRRQAASSPSVAAASEGVTLEDFHAYMPMHNYIFVPTGQTWPASSVNAKLPSVVSSEGEGAARGKDHKGQPMRMTASAWLDRHRAVEQMTWAPGRPAVIRDELVSDGGWVPRPGCACFNLYRPPLIQRGDSRAARPWLDHLSRVYPHDAHHILRWLAQRVQRPDVKINHALVLGGMQGIGKDTILEPVRHAVGPWNVVEVSPVQLLGRFNGFVKSVILRVSEARDLGDVDRYAFYEHTKVYAAAPPDVLRVDEKNLREYAVANVCGMVITTNHKTNGLYLPADDRRHYVAWSDLTKDDFPQSYWTDLYGWYAAGGHRHVAAYLAELDLATFDPKAPPLKTPAFWEVVDANRAPEDAELEEVLEKLGNPTVTTLKVMADSAGHEFGRWLRDRRSTRQISHRMDTAGYVSVRNPDTKDGLWKTEGGRKALYVRRELSPRDRLAEAQRFMKGNR